MFPREVGDACDGRVSDGGVHSVMVVAVEPACKCSGAVGFAAVGTDVGPLLEEGSVEAFDLAVGPGPVGPAVLVGDALLPEGLVEQPAPVGEVVVGQDPLDGDPRARNQAWARRQNPAVVRPCSSARTSV